MSRAEEHLDPRRRAAVDRRLRERLAPLRPRGYRSPLRGGCYLRLPPLLFWNLLTLRFDEENRCAEFVEWFMVRLQD